MGLGGRVPKLEFWGGASASILCCPMPTGAPFSEKEKEMNSPGRRLMNGLNSSSSPPALKPDIRPLKPPPLELEPFASDPGRPGAPSSTSSAARSSASEGSKRGCRKARKRLSM